MSGEDETVQLEANVNSGDFTFVDATGRVLDFVEDETCRITDSVDFHLEYVNGAWRYTATLCNPLMLPHKPLAGTRVVMGIGGKEVEAYTNTLGHVVWPFPPGFDPPGSQLLRPTVMIGIVIPEQSQSAAA